MGWRSSYHGVLRRTVDSWRGHPVVVLGDVMLDDWRLADAQRLCREAPVPVVTLRGRHDAAGTAANTAVNLAALGARPVLVAPVGDDAAGRRVRACLADAGVMDRTVTVPGHRTCTKRRLVAAGPILSCEEHGRHAGPLPEDTVDDLLDQLAAVAAGSVATPALVTCDYRLGALDDRVRRWLASHRDQFRLVALDARDLGRWAGLAPTVLTPNYSEAAALFTLVPAEPADGDRAALARRHAPELLGRTGAWIAAVTLDVAGAVVVTADGNSHRTRAEPAPASHAVGAGDAYLAAMTLSLVVLAEVSVAAELAQLAAGASLGPAGTCVCSRSALLAVVRDGDAGPGPCVVEVTALTEAMRHYRERNARVVFTNGCFDVLHRGHVEFLAQARQLGDVLIVAVNSDASIRRLKGPERPVNNTEDRVAVLAALSCVDHVIVFTENTPAALIEAIRPDLYVKGGDYHPDTVPEAPLVRRFGGDVQTLDYLPDRSTSAVIERIRSRAPVPRLSTIDATA
jgi:D-beta-D-heptose 7-phosphate kinase/D-beta-D-heptose 1-phosphate adenosyltransferase